MLSKIRSAKIIHFSIYQILSTKLFKKIVIEDKPTIFALK